ncbi:multiple monosaccharide ABC transporter permease [Pseudomonas oryzihabitans]|uniref:Xylose transport system permease protein XylH n=1 Tax=Pseudomonas oryzihabitans TaxID=47885 RepID=A0A2Z5ACN9_9PSED|nr:multiple monosaccharide ABC transporter permease [Pseudomonas oryzihabitans]AXA67839.1 ABC transporter permease [Pseudomonas oryzihabitans]
MSEVTAPLAQKRSLMPSLKRSAREYGLLASLLVIVVFFQIATGGALLQPLNLTNLLLQNSYIVVMALGMLMVIVCGHIDLSVGSIVGVIGAIAAVLMVQMKLDFITTSIVCILAGGVIGAAQGYWVAFWRMPSFIVTLAGMLVFRGATIAISGGQSIGPFPANFTAISSGFIPELFEGTGLKLTSLLVGILVAGAFWVVELRSRKRLARNGGQVGSKGLFLLKNGILTALIVFFCYQLATYRGLPTVLIIMSVLIAVYTFIMNRTVLGRWIYAVGGNLKAAKLSGIDTAKVTFFTFVNMGILAAIAGLIFTSRLNSATPRAGLGFELDVIAAVFIGGASASGGVGKVVGVVIGAFIMGVLNNGMSILGVGVDYQQMIKGAVLLAAVFVDVYQKNKSASA